MSDHFFDDFLIMSEAMAAELAMRSANGRNRIAPRLIEAGALAGSYAVGVEVLEDPENDLMMDVFRNLPRVTLDTDATWAPTEVNDNG